MSDRQLHEVEPREQVGARTGDLYEYQYHQAANGALSLLDDTKVICVYCEWHDDYVLESPQGPTYHFFQVKTRVKSKGPWRLAEFFGLGKKKKNSPPPAAEAASIFGFLLDHTAKFGARCSGFTLVTDAGLHPDFGQLLRDVKDPSTADAGASNPLFATLFQALAQTFPGLTEASLKDFLRRTEVVEGVGAIQDLPGCRLLVAGRILEASEVDLALSDARKIGEDLVAAVRDRSHRTLGVLPTTVADLRSAKGLQLEDLLRLLSLSAEGYRQLKVGGRASVLALSRLQRLCRRNGVPDSLVPHLCALKTAWDAWWVEERHHVDSLDHLALKAACADLLRLHSAGTLPIEQLISQSRQVESQHRTRLASSTPLTPELVVGLVFALAVEAEA